MYNCRDPLVRWISTGAALSVGHWQHDAMNLTVEKLAAVLRQRDRWLAVARHPHGLDEPLLAKVPQVAQPRICVAIIVVMEITT